jgi:hypothetical protein
MKLGGTSPETGSGPCNAETRRLRAGILPCPASLGIVRFG